MRRAALLLGLLVGACSGEPSPTGSSQPSLKPTVTGPLAGSVIVSDPSVPPTSVSTSAAASSAVATVVYVSLPPGTLPDSASVRIANLRTADAVTPEVVAGGFDPIAIPAVAGDTLDVAVSAASGTTSHTQVVAVRARPPRVVRTNPPRGQTDVPLNAVIVIVISEPIDPNTVNPNGIRLRLGGDPVEGSLILDPSGVMVRFTPESPLLPNANYQLEVTRELADRTGAPLETAVTIPFTTAAPAVTPEPPLALNGAWDFTDRQAFSGLVCSDTGSFMFSQSGATVLGLAWSTGACLNANGVGYPLSGGGALVSAGSVQGHSVSFRVGDWQYVGDLAAGCTDSLSGTATSGRGTITWRAVRGGPLGSMTLDPPSLRLVVARCRIMRVPQGSGGDECEAPRVKLVMRTLSGARAFRPVTWTSENSNVASLTVLPTELDELGDIASVTGVATGSTTLTATADGQSAVAPIAVGTVSFASVSGTISRLVCGVSAGTVYCWDRDTRWGVEPQTPTPVDGVPGLTQVTQGFRHTCGLTVQGTAYCWGENQRGALGNGLPEEAAPYRYWPPSPVSGGLPFASISAGGYTTCGVTSGGQAYCWGNRNSVPVPVPGGHIFASVSTGWSGSCGIDRTGQALCWGDNLSGQLGDGTFVDQSTPVPVGVGLTFASITTSGEHTCALTLQGAAYCWGNNRGGQLGIGSWSASPNPVPTTVAGGLVFQSITAAQDGGVVQWTCGLTTGGAAYCWGFPGYIDTDSDIVESEIRTAPTVIPGGIRFRSISTAGDGACGISVEGVTYCWVGFSGPARVIGQPAP
jgi:hypothetical protein